MHVGLADGMRIVIVGSDVRADIYVMSDLQESATYFVGNLFDDVVGGSSFEIASQFATASVFNSLKGRREILSKEQARLEQFLVLPGHQGRFLTCPQQFSLPVHEVVLDRISLLHQLHLS